MRRYGRSKLFLHGQLLDYEDVEKTVIGWRRGQGGGREMVGNAFDVSVWRGATVTVCVLELMQYFFCVFCRAGHFTV